MPKKWSGFLGQDTNMQNASITIVSGFQEGDTLNFNQSGSISGSWDPQKRSLTLSGEASIKDYENALNSIKFQMTG